MLNFCFAKSNLRVLEDIWEKIGRKVNDIVEKAWNPFVSKTMILSRNLGTKKWKKKLASLSSSNIYFFKVTLQHNINMMCKIREYDACWSCVKILNFGSKTFKILEFFLWIDLLFRDIQHFVFHGNTFFRFRSDEFTWPQHYGNPKFWPKISHSEKSVEFLLTKLDMPPTLKDGRTYERV